MESSVVVSKPSGGQLSTIVVDTAGALAFMAQQQPDCPVGTTAAYAGSKWMFNGTTWAPISGPAIAITGTPTSSGSSFPLIPVLLGVVVLGFLLFKGRR